MQSVAESSFDAWIKFNQPTSDDMNTTVSFYDSGAVVSFLLDLELRARTENRVSMDTLMVEMVSRFPAERPRIHDGRSHRSGQSACPARVLRSSLTDTFVRRSFFRWRNE